MKKYISILIILLAGSFVSCKKFLDEKQVSNLTQDYYKTEEGANALINGLYVYARVKHEWDVNGARLTQAETDAYMTASNTYSILPATTYGSNVSTIAASNVFNYIGSANAANAPMGAYPHINNCNVGLDVIDNLKPGKYGTDETFRKQKRSEVLFLRA
ncbi:MAG: hypothetical protein V4676_08705, partial [Bacteroidota bacterium]